jgi:hypothetical protein
MPNVPRDRDVFAVDIAPKSGARTTALHVPFARRSSVRHTLRQALWALYGPQMQQAWRDQLLPGPGLPAFDPDEPF